MNTLKENKTLFIYIILFLIISSISIYSASMYLSPLLGKLYIKQVFWYIIGIIIIMLISKISIKDIYKSSYIIYIINILFLILLLFVAPPINGSKSWFTIGKISIQPSPGTFKHRRGYTICGTHRRHAASTKNRIGTFNVLRIFFEKRGVKVLLPLKPKPRQTAAISGKQDFAQRRSKRRRDHQRLLSKLRTIIPRIVQTTCQIHLGRLVII